jgi:hypothetical protein
LGQDRATVGEPSSGKCRRLSTRAAAGFNLFIVLQEFVPFRTSWRTALLQQDFHRVLRDVELPCDLLVAESIASIASHKKARIRLAESAASYQTFSANRLSLLASTSQCGAFHLLF